MKAGLIGRSADLHHIKFIIRFRRPLIDNVLLPHLVGHIATRDHPATPSPEVLAPITLLQAQKLSQQPVKTIALQIGHRPRYRQLRHNRDQQMHMVAVARSSVDLHFLAPGNIPNKLAAHQTYIAPQDLVPILRRPYQVILQAPASAASTLIVLHAPQYLPSSKGKGFPDPLPGTLNSVRSVHSGAFYETTVRRGL